MKQVILTGAVLGMLGASAAAESLGERLKGGLSQIGEGTMEIGRAVGDGASKVVDSMGDSIESTTELIEGEETPEANRAKLDSMAEAAMRKLLSENADARRLFDTSAGYAVFDTRKVTLLGVTGGGGRGVAISPEGAHIYMKMATGGVGLAFGIGGFETQVVILFEDPATFETFVTEGLDATAEAGAMVNEDRDDLRAQFIDGRAYFYVGKRGWRVAASAAGTRYWRDAALNE